MCQPVSADLPPLPPALAARYVLQRPLGGGAAGQVFLAWDSVLSVSCAIKIVSLAPTDSGWTPTQFRESSWREARTLANLSHGHIVRIFDLHEDAGRIFLILEYVPGGSLETALAATGPLSPDDVLALLQPLCSAIDYCHRAGVVHRDLKPSNILLGFDGPHLPAAFRDVTVKVADFGIAKITAGPSSHQTRLGWAGSPGYLSPSRWAGQPATASDDIFALGAIVCRALSGQPPSLSAADVMAGRLDPSLQLLPPRFQPVLARAMSPSPADRPASAAEFCQLFASAMGGPIASPGPGVGPTHPPRPARLWAALAVCLFVLAAISWLAWRSSLPSSNRTAQSLVRNSDPQSSAPPAASSPNQPQSLPSSLPASSTSQFTPPASSNPTAIAPAQPIPDLSIPSGAPAWGMARSALNPAGLFSTFRVPDPPKLAWSLTFDHPIQGAPAIAANGAIVVSSGPAIHLISPQGGRLGEFPLPVPAARGLVLLRDGTLVVPGAGARLFVARPLDHSFNALPLPAEPASEPVTDGQSLFLAFSDGSWRSFDADGRLRWTSTAFGSPCRAPASLVNGLLIATCSSSIRVLGASDGRDRWLSNFDDPIIDAPCYHSGRLFVATADRRLSSFDLQGRLLWQVILPAVAVAGPTASPREGAVLLPLADRSIYLVDDHDTRRVFASDSPFLGSSLLASDQTLLQSSGSSLLALFLTGQQRWRLPLSASDYSIAALSRDGGLLMMNRRSLLKISQ